MIYDLKIYTEKYIQDESHLDLPPLGLPASRAGKILLFKHYQTDAPV